MKGRKWWFIGLPVVLVIACFFCWKWSERPPFKFMGGMSLVFCGPAVYPGKYVLLYSSPELGDPLALAAAKETGTKQWSYRSFTREEDGAVLAIESRSSTLYAAFADQLPPLPRSTTSIVMVVRTPTVGDRFKGWLYGMRWRGFGP